MKRIALLGAVALAGAALAAGGAVAPASAAPGDTTVTFTLTGGALSVAVQPSANLGSFATGTLSVSGQLGNVTVTDNRGGILPWITSASYTGFSGPNSSKDVTSTYNAGTFTTTGTVTMVPALPVVLTALPLPVAAAAVVLGNNTASWNPTLTVVLLPNATAGTYTTTVSTSVA